MLDSQQDVFYRPPGPATATMKEDNVEDFRESEREGFLRIRLAGRKGSIKFLANVLESLWISLKSMRGRKPGM